MTRATPQGGDVSINVGDNVHTSTRTDNQCGPTETTAGALIRQELAYNDRTTTMQTDNIMWFVCGLIARYLIVSAMLLESTLLFEKYVEQTVIRGRPLNSIANHRTYAIGDSTLNTLP